MHADLYLACTLNCVIIAQNHNVSTIYKYIYICMQAILFSLSVMMNITAITYVWLN